MRAILLLVPLALGGCVTAGAETPLADNLPGNYRGVISERVRATFFDPYSIRDAAISAPISGVSIYGPVVTVCVRANAKNRMGAYTGLSATAFVFRGGQITATNTDQAEIICGNASYGPFPEIVPATQ